MKRYTISRSTVWHHNGLWSIYDHKLQKHVASLWREKKWANLLCAALNKSVRRKTVRKPVQQPKVKTRLSWSGNPIID